MLREIDDNLISADKLMKSGDMAKVGCNDCKGCSECCKDRAADITLDPYDVNLLKEGLDCGFQDLMNSGLLQYVLMDGVIVPALGKKKDADECVFLGEDGRCKIHNYRPGICRMFPLARLYHEDGTFSYFMQEGECDRLNGVKIKISKWLGYPNIKEYEQSVSEYHAKLVEHRTICNSGIPQEEEVRLQKKFLLDNFIRG